MRLESNIEIRLEFRCFIVKYEKMTLFDEFLVLLGPIISRFFCMFK